MPKRSPLRSLAVPIAAVSALVGLVGMTRAGQVEPAGRVLSVPHPHPKAVKVLVSAEALGLISADIFGSNLLWPYDAEGAFDQQRHRFYPSFVKAVRSLGVTALRYPGGITSDSFDWRRAIGPEPRRLPNEPYAMQAAKLSRICCTLDGPAPSTVGPDEFGALIGQLGATGTITVNFVTGSPQEAADFVAYMTAPVPRHPARRLSPSERGYWAERRAHNGHPAPYNVRWWEVGNEQDGPGQFGWRSGQLVRVGPHRSSRAAGRCPREMASVCLYAFGGTTYFAHQPVGTFADTYKGAALSKGSPNEHFYVYFPPVIPRSQEVFVGGKRWRLVSARGLTHAGPRAHVFAFVPQSGEITFGNGEHGAVPREGSRVTASYESGPHGGFVEFYKAMKAMNPHIHVCESEESNTAFLRVMGPLYRYDCAELHEYAKPLDIRAPMPTYEEGLFAYPAQEGDQLSALQRAVKRWSHHNIPVVLTEYGQLIVPMPVEDPAFNMSLDQALLTASQLRQWIDHNLPLAEKYLLDSTPFLNRYRLAISVNETGLSIDSAMVAGPGPPFVVEPTGEALGLMSRFGGAQRLRSEIVDDPLMEPYHNARIPVLQSLAAWTGHALDILVINDSPSASVKSLVDLGGIKHGRWVVATLLDGPSALAFNNISHPHTVAAKTSRRAVKPDRNFWWTFPAHSLSLLELDGA